MGHVWLVASVSDSTDRKRFRHRKALLDGAGSQDPLGLGEMCESHAFLAYSPGETSGRRPRTGLRAAEAGRRLSGGESAPCRFPASGGFSAVLGVP